LFTPLDRSFFPDFLFTFGEKTNNVFSEKNYFIKKENVIPIGSMYLDYINNEYQPSEKTRTMFFNYRKKYEKIVAVASQWTIEEKLIKFIKKAARLNNDILYIFVPRDTNKDYSLVEFPNNVVILKDLNIYQIIKESDFHSTVFSTTAIEAPALGIPNILINIDGFAKKYYSDILTDRNTTIIAETEQEFIKILDNRKKISKKIIMDAHEGFYKQNHKENIKRAIDIVEERI
jgi:hypothetical protein